MVIARLLNHQLVCHFRVLTLPRRFSKGKSTLAVVSKILPHIALYNHYITHRSIGGICWYISRVLSRSGTQLFPLTFGEVKMEVHKDPQPGASESSIFFTLQVEDKLTAMKKKTASWVGWWWELKYYSVFIGKYFISHEARNFYTTRIQWKVRVGIFWILQLQNLPNFWSVTSNIGDYERV